MKLTRHQFKVLRVWLRYHSRGYGIGQMLRSAWKPWLLLAMMGVLSYYFCAPISPAQAPSQRPAWGLFCIFADFRPVPEIRILPPKEEIIHSPERLHSRIPAIVFLVLGVGFIVFSRQVIAAFNWLSRKIWTEERRRQFPGFGGRTYEPWMAVLLGASWVGCAVFFWFISR